MSQKPYDLTDFEWNTIQPLLPAKPRGVPRVDDRRVLNGIFFVLRSGMPWADLPERYGPCTTVYNRFNRWRKRGVWDTLMDAIILKHKSPDDKVQMIESTSVRVHQQAAAQEEQGEDFCIGRSRGGLTTKLHLRVNQIGLPLQIELTPGQVHDAPMAEVLLQSLPRGTDVIADRGYDADWIRKLIQDQDCTPVIPPKSNRIYKLRFSKRKYKKRNLVERCINKLKQCRHIATRYDPKASAYLSFTKLAAVRLWLRYYESAT